MFEDETLDLACPKCGHMNSILVRDFEENAETHFVCEGCKAGVRIEGKQFHERLGQMRKELAELERKAATGSKPKARPRKDDFQI
ncbi:MAG TPA: hypothetical protein VEJ86_05240 [Candidatus Binataceae bacterium]|nr:hypothetical protein [Candidatus Binataceae bacterium]